MGLLTRIEIRSGGERDLSEFHLHTSIARHRRRQDDDRAARSAHTPLRHRRDRQRQLAWQGIQRDPSGEIPPPVTIIWTWGWWVIADPQVCRTAATPILAPQVLGVGDNCQHGVRGSMEQEVIDHRLVW